MRIIPAIDIIDGKCVRLTQGDYNSTKTYSENPLEWAKRLQDHGVKFLHLVDLEGAKAQQIVNYKTLELLATQTDLHIDFGGGIKSTADVELAFQAGATQITVGSIAVQKPELFLSWLDHYGAERIILGADCAQRQIATHGWLEKSQWEVVAFLQHYRQQGVQYSVVTDIAKDGMLNGPAWELYAEILQTTTVELIASGGITTIDDVHRLSELGCEGAIIGKALYEGTITFNQLRDLC